jgi:glyoxylase-like metal-dependent hydrolase (beta-lactamase superfamily II)
MSPVRILRAWSMLVAGAVVVGGARGHDSVTHLVPVLTEEGQKVVFNKFTWQQRELAKRLPLEEPWPTGAAYGRALARYGLDRDPPPLTPPLPSRILPDVYLIGQDTGNNLTYLVDCGPEGVAIVDPSFEWEFEKTIARAVQCGRPREDIRWVLNTHCHFDHSMAGRKFRDAGAQILIHQADADAIEKGTRLTVYYRSLVPGRPAEFPRTKVDRLLSDGEDLRLGNKLFHVIHTPGHTPGSSCFLLQVDGRSVLFTGDNLFYDGLLAWQGNPYADNARYAASLAKLARYTLDDRPVRADVLLPGHHAIVLENAHLDVEKARDFAALDVAAGQDIHSAPWSRPEYRRMMFGRPAVPPR